MASYVTKSEFARMTGVDAKTITNQASKALKGAIVKTKVDLDHPNAIQFLKDHPTDYVKGEKSVAQVNAKKVPTGRAAQKQKKKEEALNNVDQATEVEDTGVSRFLDMTLEQIIQKHGTDVAFLDWLKATKTIEEIEEKRIKNSVSKGDLVSKDIIKVGIFDPLDSALNQILSDGAKTLAVRISTMVKADVPIEQCELEVRDQLSSFIRPMKSRIIKTLKSVS